MGERSQSPHGSVAGAEPSVAGAEPSNASTWGTDDTVMEVDRPMKTIMMDIWGKYGGPMQHLMSFLNNGQAKLEFANWLKHNVPLQSHISYELQLPVASVVEGSESEQGLLYIPIWLFGFTSTASTREAPGSHQAGKVLDYIMAQGFQTATEPILMSQPQDCSLKNKKAAIAHKARAECNANNM